MAANHHFQILAQPGVVALLLLSFLAMNGDAFTSDGSNSGVIFHKDTGGYSLDVDVGVDSRIHVPQASDDWQFLTELIKKFNTASTIMHSVTKHHAYIREVRFLLPDHWPMDNLRHELQCAGDMDNRRNHVSIEITKVGGKGEKKCGHVTGTQICGHPVPTPGKMTLPWGSLSTNYTLECGSPAMEFVHEFAHLRWGLGDEYGGDLHDDEDEGACPNTTTSLNLMAAIACNDTTPVQFSVSSDRDGVVVHNKNINSKHNRICGKRSAWDVLRTRTADFETFYEGKISRSPEQLRPKILLITKCRGESTVFVVDLSGNTSDGRLRKASKAIRKHIQRSSQYSNFAVVTYGTEQRTQHAPPLLRPNSIVTRMINVDATRLMLLKSTNKTDFGSLSDALDHGNRIVNVYSSNNPIPCDKNLHKTARTNLMQLVVISDKPAFTPTWTYIPGFDTNTLFVGANLSCLNFSKQVPNCDSTFGLPEVYQCSERPIKCLREYFESRTRRVFQETKSYDGTDDDTDGDHLPFIAGKLDIPDPPCRQCNTTTPRKLRFDMTLVVYESDVLLERTNTFNCSLKYTITKHQVGRHRKVYKKDMCKVNDTDLSESQELQKFHTTFKMSDTYGVLTVKLNLPVGNGSYHLMINATPKRRRTGRWADGSTSRPPAWTPIPCRGVP